MKESYKFTKLMDNEEQTSVEVISQELSEIVQEFYFFLYASGFDESEIEEALKQDVVKIGDLEEVIIENK